MTLHKLGESFPGIVIYNPSILQIEVKIAVKYGNTESTTIIVPDLPSRLMLDYHNLKSEYTFMTKSWAHRQKGPNFRSRKAAYLYKYNLYILGAIGQGLTGKRGVCYRNLSSIAFLSPYVSE